MRVLLVENNYSDAIVIAKMLTEASLGRGAAVEITSTDRLSVALEHLRALPPDALILDLGLPEACDLDPFALAHAAAPGVPCVVLSRAEDEPAAAAALRGGAQTYLFKAEITTALLWRSLEHAIELARLTERILVLTAERDERDELLFGRRVAGERGPARAAVRPRALVQDDLDEALEAAERAGALVADLLVPEPRCPLEPPAVVSQPAPSGVRRLPQDLAAIDPELLIWDDIPELPRHGAVQSCS